MIPDKKVINTLLMCWGSPGAGGHTKRTRWLFSRPLQRFQNHLALAKDYVDATRQRIHGVAVQHLIQIKIFQRLS